MLHPDFCIAVSGLTPEHRKFCLPGVMKHPSTNCLFVTNLLDIRYEEGAGKQAEKAFHPY